MYFFCPLDFLSRTWKPSSMKAALQSLQRAGKETPFKLKPADAILLSADLLTRTSLTKLAVDENPLGIEGGQVLCEVLARASNSPLRQLSMANTGLGPRGGAAVGMVLGLPGILTCTSSLSLYAHTLAYGHYLSRASSLSSLSYASRTLRDLSRTRE